MMLLYAALLRALVAGSLLLLRASADSEVGSLLASASTRRRIVNDANQHEVHARCWSPLPRTYVSAKDLPMAFSWGAVNGVSYLTKSMNQHLEQYCGSCFVRFF
jgi:hypothetical protein